VGTPEGDEIKDPSSASLLDYNKLIVLTEVFDTELENLPDIVNDLDIDFTEDPAASIAYLNDQRNRRKVLEATEKLNINIISPFREGKKLLVLDIDYSEEIML
jgi:ubiquitin-like domain-containing CTD phosphatase 1